MILMFGRGVGMWWGKNRESVIYNSGANVFVKGKGGGVRKLREKEQYGWYEDEGSYIWENYAYCVSSFKGTWLPEPLFEENEGDHEALFRELWGILMTWGWEGDDKETPFGFPLSLMIFVGWMGAALYGQAQRWRPHIWLGGARALGKSTLLRLHKMLFRRLVVTGSDFTSVGIKRALRGYPRIREFARGLTR